MKITNHIEQQPIQKHLHNGLYVVTITSVSQIPTRHGDAMLVLKFQSHDIELDENFNHGHNSDRVRAIAKTKLKKIAIAAGSKDIPTDINDYLGLQLAINVVTEIDNSCAGPRSWRMSDGTVIPMAYTYKKRIKNYLSKTDYENATGAIENV